MFKHTTSTGQCPYECEDVLYKYIDLLCCVDEPSMKGDTLTLTSHLNKETILRRIKPR